MDKRYLIVVKGSFCKTILDIREISHITDNFSLNNTKTLIYMKNGKEIEVSNPEEFFADLKELENQTNDKNEQL